MERFLKKQPPLLAFFLMLCKIQSVMHENPDSMVMEKTVVLENREVKNFYHLIRLRASAIAPRVQPGQFVHIKIPGLNESVLRRPFSIFKAGSDELSILYKKIGKGTAALATQPEGTTLSVFGPLGNGFPVPSKAKHTILVAGGYGVAPLFMLAKQAPAKGTLIAGGRSAVDILCVDDFSDIGWDIILATEDGSMGTKGLVTDVLSDHLSKHNGSDAEMFACGPDGMLKAVSKLAEQAGSSAWISLDRHMGCGVGACLACVQKIKTESCSKNPDTPNWTWARVCVDGPVFESKTILWEKSSQKSP